MKMLHRLLSASIWAVLAPLQITLRCQCLCEDTGNFLANHRAPGGLAWAKKCRLKEENTHRATRSRTLETHGRVGKLWSGAVSFRQPDRKRDEDLGIQNEVAVYSEPAAQHDHPNLSTLS